MRNLLSAVVLLLLVQVSNAKPERSWMDDDWIAFIKEHRELYLEIFPIAKRMDSNSSMTAEQAHKIQKIVHGRPMYEQRVLFRMMNHIRRIRRFDDPIFGPSTSNDPMEEVVVIGRMFDQFPMDPAEFSFIDTAGMRNIQKKAPIGSIVKVDTMRRIHCYLILQSEVLKNRSRDSPTSFLRVLRKSRKAISEHWAG